MSGKSDLRACWYRLLRKPRPGRLHIFTTDHIEYEEGPGQFPVGVVEDEDTGAVHIVPAEDICFGSVPKFSSE